MKSRFVKGKSGYKIIYVPAIKTKNGNYLGMNNEAAKSRVIHTPYPKSLGKNTLLLREDLTDEQKQRFAVHEVVEKSLMDDNHENWGYEKSHRVANILEHNPDILIRVRGSSRARGSTRKNKEYNNQVNSLR